MNRAAWRRQLVALGCAVAIGLPGVAGCGLPTGGRTQVVDDDSVPYDLLDADDDAFVDPTDGQEAPRGVPVVFWLRADELLSPAGVEASCGQSPAAVVRSLLDALLASPSATERDSGLASAIPSTASLSLVQVEDGVAEVELDPVAFGDAERLPLAVGQVVLTVTSAPGVDSVRLVTSGRSVDLPLPGGALTTDAVTADDYAVLLPRRLDDDPARGFGCAT